MSQTRMVELLHEIEREQVQAASKTKMGSSRERNQKRPREEEATFTDLMSKGVCLLIELLLMQFRVHTVCYSWDRLRSTRKEQPKEDIFCLRKLLCKEKKV
jgi:hypothetical protein